MTLEAINQIFLAVFGVTAVFLSQSPNPNTSRYACVFGMLGQPFWFYATWTAGQWGIFILCIFYAVAWGRGIYNRWLIPYLDSKRPSAKPDEMQGRHHLY